MGDQDGWLERKEVANCHWGPTASLEREERRLELDRALSVARGLWRVRTGLRMEWWGHAESILAATGGTTSSPTGEVIVASETSSHHKIPQGYMAL